MFLSLALIFVFPVINPIARWLRASSNSAMHGPNQAGWNTSKAAAQDPRLDTCTHLIGRYLQHAFVPTHNHSAYLVITWTTFVGVGLGLQCMHVICRKSRHAWSCSALGLSHMSLIPGIPVTSHEHLFRPHLHIRNATSSSRANHDEQSKGTSELIRCR